MKRCFVTLCLLSSFISTSTLAEEDSGIDKTKAARIKQCLQCREKKETNCKEECKGIEIKGLSYPFENPHGTGGGLNKNHEDKIEKTPHGSGGGLNK